MITRNTLFPNIINKRGYKIAIEIGVYKGLFSEHLLKTTKLNQLYCVDIWEDLEIFNEASERLKDSRVTMFKTTSLQATAFVPNNTIDFIYIDGAHDLKGIYEDINAWVPKVKIGGCVAGHDFKDCFRSTTLDYYGRPLVNKVKTVIEDFTQRYGYQLYTTEEACKSWLFYKTHEAVNDLKINMKGGK